MDIKLEKKIETVEKKSVVDVVALQSEIEELKKALALKDEIKNIPISDVKKQTPEEWLNERVPYKAFKDTEKYKDDIHVGINGYNYVIQRGVTVMIPRFVYFAIKDSDRQTLEADTNASKKADEFSNESKQFGISL